MTTTRYIHQNDDMTAEVSFNQEDDVFFFSTTVYKNGEPYTQMVAKCVNAEAQNMLSAITGGIAHNGFVPVEEDV